MPERCGNVSLLTVLFWWDAQGHAHHPVMAAINIPASVAAMLISR
jgi:hypothetical protein